MNLTKKQIIAISVAAAFLAVLAMSWWLFMSDFTDEKQKTYVYIDETDTRDAVFQKLETAAHPSQMLGVRIASAVLGYGSHIRAGRYEIGRGLGSMQLVRNLRNGHQSPVNLVIPVVHTMGELASHFAKSLKADSATLSAAFSNPTELARLGVDTFTVPTLFIPNTYEVYWNITPQNLLERMKRERDSFWSNDRMAEAKQAGLSPNEVYTLASIVEQESANEQERPVIAGMYLNRLHAGMKLQADPTVKYALRNFALRRILHAHLAANSPYNTYLNEGLPPGPICIPSLNAIESVLHFSHHNYLYMCAKEDFSGTHNFAVTYEEHLANAKKYAEALNKRNILK